MTTRPIASDEAPAAIGPYAQAQLVEAGRQLLFVSGQIPLSPTSGSLVEGTIEDETRAVMANLSAVVAAAGGTLKNVVKTTIYLTDLADFAAVNAVYGELLGSHRPARATVQVAALPKGARVEIDAVAAL